MKTIIAAVLVIILVLSLTACGNEELSEEGIPDQKPSVSENSYIQPALEDSETKTGDISSPYDDICEKIILDFGASYISEGKYCTPKGQPTAFDCGYFTDAAFAPAETYFYWLFNFSETFDEAQSYPFGEINGSAFSAELFEDYALRYFGADIEYLRFSDIYSPEEGLYKNEAQPMHFDYPINLVSYEINGNLMNIHLEMKVYDGERTSRSVLSAELFDDGSYRIKSYLPEDYEFYKEILFNFGADENKGFLVPYDSSLSTFSGTRKFSNASEISDMFYYIWYFSHMHRLGLSNEELFETFSGPGENSGWAYPAEYFEPAAEKFFGTSPEELRTRDFYDSENDWYYIYTGAPGKGESPKIILKSVEEYDDMLIFRLITAYFTQPDIEATLTVRLDTDGSYHYISYIPEE